MKAYRDANFWVASRAMGRCRCLHLLRVFVVGPHDVALAAIVGVVPPMCALAGGVVAIDAIASLSR